MKKTSFDQIRFLYADRDVAEITVIGISQARKEQGRFISASGLSIYWEGCQLITGERKSESYIMRDGGEEEVKKILRRLNDEGYKEFNLAVQNKLKSGETEIFYPDYKFDELLVEAEKLTKERFLAYADEIRATLDLLAYRAFNGTVEEDGREFWVRDQKADYKVCHPIAGDVYMWWWPAMSREALNESFERCVKTLMDKVIKGTKYPIGAFGWDAEDIDFYHKKGADEVQSMG